MQQGGNKSMIEVRHSLAHGTRTQVYNHLTPVDSAAPRSRTAPGHFRALSQQTVMIPEIVRVKIQDHPD